MASDVAGGETTQRVLWGGPVESGLPPLDNFILDTCPAPGPLGNNEVLVELQYVSVDPYMRGRMRDSAGYFVGPFEKDKPLTGECVGTVVDSKHAAMPKGAHVKGFLVWQKLQVVPEQMASQLQVLDTSINKDMALPLTLHMGPLGMVGMTAYCSLERIGQPKAGDTVFVSGAAGAVGVLVGQLCKHVYGCHVVGSAGTDQKVSELSKYGYDAAFNYKTTSVLKGLAQHCPKGIDVYFDNVGGETLEGVLEHCNTHARVVGCGAISQYNAASEERYGVKNLFLVVTKRIKYQGFIVGDFGDMAPAFKRDMTQYVRDGKVKLVEHVTPGGLGECGRAFREMMTGANMGKSVVQCGTDPFRKSS